jgi:hypothetical protein
VVRTIRSWTTLTMRWCEKVLCVCFCVACVPGMTCWGPVRRWLAPACAWVHLWLVAGLRPLSRVPLVISAAQAPPCTSRGNAGRQGHCHGPRDRQLTQGASNEPAPGNIRARRRAQNCQVRHSGKSATQSRITSLAGVEVSGVKYIQS